MDDLIISGKCSDCGKPAIHGMCKKCMDKNKMQALEDQLANLQAEVKQLCIERRKAYRVSMNKVELERLFMYAETTEGSVVLKFHNEAIGTAIAVGTVPECLDNDDMFKDITDIDSW